MVSFWPWKSEKNSPASFEKTLSALAHKISTSQTRLDSLRSNHKRYKALWTLYTTILFLLGLVVLVLVVGWKNWSIWEGSLLAGFPIIIYLGRKVLSSYYTYRIDSVVERLEEQQEERFKTIEKLKAATKYNSTQELLEKYGASKPKSKRLSSTPKTPKSTRQPSKNVVVPPPTANIVRSDQPPPQRPITQQVMSQHTLYHVPQDVTATPNFKNLVPPVQSMLDMPEFAPNAFTAPPEYAQDSNNAGEGHWYDRVLDLLLGEDETLPRNRIALICRNCRLVNGQAPPGTKSIADIGKWRCFSCGLINEPDKIEVEYSPNASETPTILEPDHNEESNNDDESQLNLEDTGQIPNITEAEEVIATKPKKKNRSRSRKHSP